MASMREKKFKICIKYTERNVDRREGLTMMDVQQPPPPLPPKSRKLVESTSNQIANETPLQLKAVSAQPKMVITMQQTNASNCTQTPMNGKGVIVKSTPDAEVSISPPREDKPNAKQSVNIGSSSYGSPSRIINVKKSFSLNSRKANGFVGRIASAFSEPLSNRSDSGFKITTWAEKKIEEKLARKPEDDFLYQNVSNTGTNYLEYKLKHIINNNPTKKSVMKAQGDKIGKSKIADKAKPGDNSEKTDSDTSSTWMTSVNRQIQVHQVKNKTVVKISINENTPPVQNNDAYFKPLCDDDFSLSEYQYPELLFKNNTVPKKVNEYAEPFCGNISKTVQLYANVDLSKKRKRSADGLIYENTDVGNGNEKQTYMNVNTGIKSSNEVYANVNNENSPVIEHHYFNISGATVSATEAAEDNESQVYENEDFTVLRNSQVTQSIIEKNSLPTREDVYENTEFISINNVLDDIKFSGPGIKEISGYQTPKSALRLVVNDFDTSAMNNTKMPYIIKNYSQSSMEDEQYSPSETFDSGTSSDQENTVPNTKVKNGKLIVTVNAQNEKCHKRAESVTSSGVGIDSEASDTESSNISCDSLNSNDLRALSVSEDHGYHTPTSENKTASPIEGIEYQKFDGKEGSPEPPNSAPPYFENNPPFKLHDSEELESIDIIKQVANAARRLSNLRLENTGLYLAKRVESCDDVYENYNVYDTPSTIVPVAPPLPMPIENSEEEFLDTDGMKTLPKNLLRDIRSKSVRLMSTYPNGVKVEESKSQLPKSIVKIFQKEEPIVEKVPDRKHHQRRVMIKEQTYEERKSERIRGMEVDTDKFYKFHLCENILESVPEKPNIEEETFAGVRDYLNRERPHAITSAKGTIRGVKNRVKAGIATFLQLQEAKTYKDKDAGKIVIYSTTMGIVRETYQKCLKVKQILKTLMVKFEDRDVFMSTEAQDEIRERMKCKAILVPQVFVEGQHIGDAETIERLNESGELRKILRPYKSLDAGSTCSVCGGYRLMPCRVCKGSKKSIHRNSFTADFVSLKCMNCDPVGLTKCHAC